MTASARTAKGRAGVVSAARRVLRERGLHGIRVRDVAAAGGMSPGAVMYHYPTTAELLLAVHEETQRQYLEIRAEAASRGDGADAWARLVSGFKAGLPPYADGELIELLYEMHGLTRRSPRHAVLLTELWEAELAYYQDTITQGIDEGLFEVANCKAAARMLLALEDGLALHRVSDNGSLNSSIALDTFIGAASAILGNPGLAARQRLR